MQEADEVAISQRENLRKALAALLRQNLGWRAGFNHGLLGPVGRTLRTDLVCVVSFHRVAYPGEPEDVCGCVPPDEGRLGERRGE